MAPLMRTRHFGIITLSALALGSCSFDSAGLAGRDGAGLPDASPSDLHLCGGPDGIPDQDHDGIPDCVDNCPTVPNPDQRDRDCDGVGDACDDCPTIPDPKQIGTDAGGGLACAPSLDPDGDELANLDDPWPLVPNGKLLDDFFDGSLPFGSTWTSSEGAWSESTGSHNVSQQVYTGTTPAYLTAKGMSVANVYLEAHLARTQGPADGSSASLITRFVQGPVASYYACALSFGQMPGALSIVRVASGTGASVLAAAATAGALLDTHEYVLRAFVSDTSTGTTTLACALHREGGVVGDDPSADTTLVTASDPSGLVAGSFGFQTVQAAILVTSFNAHLPPPCSAIGPICPTLENPILTSFCAP